jgi:hypothetical protein
MEPVPAVMPNLTLRKENKTNPATMEKRRKIKLYD